VKCTGLLGWRLVVVLTTAPRKKFLVTKPHKNEVANVIQELCRATEDEERVNEADCVEIACHYCLMFLSTSGDSCGCS